MDPMVLLRHNTPDNRHHFDWLITRREDKEGGLLTFRAAARIDQSPKAGDRLTRLPDHRRIYLDYEGPLTENRGSVTRVARGSCQVLAESPDRVTLECEWGATPKHRLRFEIEHEANALWIIRSVTPTDAERR